MPFSNMLTASTPPAGLGGYALPQPSNSGSLDLSGIKPVNSGSVSIAEAIAKARGIAAQKGVAYDQGRTSGGQQLLDSFHLPYCYSLHFKQ